MFPHHRAYGQYQRAKTADQASVTVEELKALLLEEGRTEAEINRTLTIMEQLGSSVLIGNTMYSIKPGEEDSLDKASFNRKS